MYNKNSNYFQMNGQSVESSQQLLLKLVFVDVKAKKKK